MPPQTEGKARAVDVVLSDGVSLRVMGCQAKLDKDRLHIWSDRDLQVAGANAPSGIRSMNVPASCAVIFWD